MAWRAHAIARGVFQSRTKYCLMQLGLGFALFAQAFTTFFTWIWDTAPMSGGNWLATAANGSCVVSEGGSVAAGLNPEVWANPWFWYFIVEVLFDAVCLGIVLHALLRLKSASRGFYSLISKLLTHSWFYFGTIFLMNLVGIIWLAVQNFEYETYTIVQIQAAIVVRILLSDQEAARRPADPSYFGQTADEPTGGRSRSRARSEMVGCESDMGTATGTYPSLHAHVHASDQEEDIKCDKQYFKEDKAAQIA